MDFYKILNKEECHHDLQYKTGLNIDSLEFYPHGDCEPGGIYFSREDILDFLHYGPWIRKVTLPEDAKIYENPKGPRKWKADKVILGEREKITFEVIKRLIDEGADPTVDDSFPLRWAAMNGQLEIVKLLLPFSNIKAYNSEALRWAAKYGHTEIVKLLIPFSDCEAYNSEALKLAIYEKYVETKLEKISLPKDKEKLIINKYTEIIKLLIPVSKIDTNIINFYKAYCDNQELLDLIIVNKNTLFHNFLRSIKNKLFKIFK